ncbi:MAG: formate dehydrogenase accessory sulfurtransferase FdhD [Gemmatimonadota bacterium]|nr:formate dehydrogenase accessory sulfurtransferase FdhD [Gemmatimonadota bacterium]
MTMAGRRRAAKVRVGRMRNGRFSTRGDSVAVEEPLEVRLEVPDGDGMREHPVSVTMRTPGDDFELAAGFLFTEGVVHDPGAFADVRYCRSVDPQEYNVVTASLRHATAFDSSSLTRNFYVTSSCGVCGKASLEAVEVMGCQAVADGTLSIGEADVRALPGKLRTAQRVFERTGGIHAAGLFDGSGEVTAVREDVGRHNAVDKVIGALVLSRALPGSGFGLVVSGRSSFEILQKAAMAGFPMVVAVGAPSSLAVAFARRFNMTLVGFTNRGGYNVYAGGERIIGAGGAA